MATWKTMERLVDGYVWPGMRKDVTQDLSKCPLCIVNSRKIPRAPPGVMPVANYSMQIVGMDLFGPIRTSASGNRYGMLLIDHCSGWIELYPIKDKSNDTIWKTFQN